MYELTSKGEFRNGSVLSLLNTHTHTHTYIYIYSIIIKYSQANLLSKYGNIS